MVAPPRSDGKSELIKGSTVESPGHERNIVVGKRDGRLGCISRQADFDSAIPRFESWRPSQKFSNKF
jgi:hypothetical protein